MRCASRAAELPRYMHASCWPHLEGSGVAAEDGATRSTLEVLQAREQGRVEARRLMCAMRHEAAVWRRHRHRQWQHSGSSNQAAAAAHVAAQQQHRPPMRSSSACLDVVGGGEVGDEGLGDLADLGVEQLGVVAWGEDTRGRDVCMCRKLSR